jgi:DNA-binding MarR family transcriptional regulator
MPSTSRRETSDTIGEFIKAWRRERPDLDPFPLGILGRVQRISARLVSATEELLEPMQIGWEAFSLIVSLRRAGKPYAMRPTDIYRQSLITSGAATNRIDRVSKLGLVRRVPDPSDRRGIIVELTPSGKTLADRAIDLQFAMLDERLSALTRSERVQLSALLSKLLFSLEAADSVSSKPSAKAPKSKQRQRIVHSAS